MQVFMKNFKIYLKVKYCEGNKDSNLHIAKGTYNPKKVKICKNTPYWVQVTLYKYGDIYCKITYHVNL
jgi:hypothetical protein